MISFSALCFGSVLITSLSFPEVCDSIPLQKTAGPLASWGHSSDSFLYFFYGTWSVWMYYHIYVIFWSHIFHCVWVTKFFLHKAEQNILFRLFKLLLYLRLLPPYFLF